MQSREASPGGGVSRKHAIIAGLTIAAIAAHLVLRYADRTPVAVSTDSVNTYDIPLFVALLLGGTPLVWDLLVKLFNRQFGSDLLAGISIVTSVVLGEYLAGTLVVLMLSGGEALEEYAVMNASSVLRALAKRMPSQAHRRTDATVESVALADLAVGDILVVFPHETCPIDGTVVEGHGVMDESYLTGEPYMMEKTPGSTVLSGAINGDSALTIRADKLAIDSRYARIMDVMRSSAQQRPRLRRLGDQLGAIYTPLAVSLGLLAWVLSGDPVRFLAVMVVATPCPLLIAIPVAIIGSISLAARRAIIVRDPAVLENADGCRTVIFDKTGTLTYGEPNLSDQYCTGGRTPGDVLSLVASVERYSKHPLAKAMIAAAKEAHLVLQEATSISERPGEGLRGTVLETVVRITSREKLLIEQPAVANQLPNPAPGLECVILLDGHYAATYQFRDTPRKEGASFVAHLQARHGFEKIMLVSGDRASEVEYLASIVGIKHVYSSQSPEQKLDIVRAETTQAKTIFVGDGINDAPALLAATIGIAFGQNSDVTTEAAGVVIMDSSLRKVDEFMHIGKRMRKIALQSAVGGMTLSLVGMLIAAAGYLSPVAGAVTQEVIDVVAVLNALRVAIPPQSLTDY
jgi:heavy metal translocating P-type ATPase